MKENTRSTPASIAKTDFGAITLTSLEAVAEKIDAIAARTQDKITAAASPGRQALAIARGMIDLRAALTDEIMEAMIAPLMNTTLGFATDRDPKVTPKDKNGDAMTPYPVAVIRDCFVDMTLRGFYPCGNEWNIISARPYVTRNGLKRRCEQWPGVTDIRLNFDVPRIVGEKGAIVHVKGTWKKNGIGDAIEADIPVRVNAGMGADAILGKAERKIYKRLHDRLSGTITVDGEVGDDPELIPTAVKASPRFDRSQSKDAEIVSETPHTPTVEQPELQGGVK